jgi:hypothetical protein
MNYRGDYAAGQVVRFHISTYSNTNAPITIAGSPTLAVYKDGGTVESLTGITLTVDFDGRTGFHLIAIDTAADAALYALGSDFSIVFTAGTVDALPIAGTVIGSFSIANRAATKVYPLVPGPGPLTNTPQGMTNTLYKIARNTNVVDPSGISIRNDTDTADDMRATHSESASVYKRNKFV